MRSFFTRYTLSGGEGGRVVIGGRERGEQGEGEGVGECDDWSGEERSEEGGGEGNSHKGEEKKREGIQNSL